MVTAWDITTSDFTDALAEWLRAQGAAGDRRIKYVIYKHHITSAEHGWQWGNYDGSDPHTNHIHLSVSADSHYYDSTAPWHIPNSPQEAPSGPSKAPTPPSGGGTTPKWFTRVLRPAEPLMHGNDVRHVQQRIGVPVADGMYGDQTAAYVKTWQHRHGLTPDGIVGPKTAGSIG